MYALWTIKELAIIVKSRMHKSKWKHVMRNA